MPNFPVGKNIQFHAAKTLTIHYYICVGSFCQSGGENTSSPPRLSSDMIATITSLVLNKCMVAHMLFIRLLDDLICNVNFAICHIVLFEELFVFCIHLENSVELFSRHRFAIVTGLASVCAEQPGKAA